MLVLSSRSYITGALDLLFPALLEYVYRELDHEKDWWRKYVYKFREDIFHKSMWNYIKPDYKPKKWEDLYNYFDEHSLCHLVKKVHKTSNSTYFVKEIKHFNNLLDIRNDWAHRVDRSNKWGDDETAKKWADDAFNIFTRAARKIKLSKYEDIVNQIASLKTKMEHDWISRDVKFRPPEELQSFLDDKVISGVQASGTINKDLQDQILKSWANLVKNAKTAEDYIDYFYHAIKMRQDVRKKVESHSLTTFEDVCAEFAVFCHTDNFENQTG